MRKLLFILLFIFIGKFCSAQNEVNLNIANTIAIASVEVGYERFLDTNQSVEFAVLFNDRINYHSEAGSRKFNTNSFKLAYNFYFSGEKMGAGVFASPFLKYRTGDFEERVVIETNGSIAMKEITDMDSFIIGLGGGYKWNFNDTFVLGPYINVGRNFSDEVKDRFSAIEFNAGFSVGYRF